MTVPTARHRRLLTLSALACTCSCANRRNARARRLVRLAARPTQRAVVIFR